MHAIETPISKVKNKLKDISKKFISDKYSSNLIQSFMDYGSEICLPRNPKCNICPLKKICFSYKNNQVHLFPFKSEKKKIKNRFFNFIVFHNSVNETIIEKRESGIWKNLYQFPLLETKNNMKKISRVEGLGRLYYFKKPKQNRSKHI